MVIGRCGGVEQTEWPRRTDKSQTKKIRKKETSICIYHHKCYVISQFNKPIIAYLSPVADLLLRTLASCSSSLSPSPSSELVPSCMVHSNIQFSHSSIPLSRKSEMEFNRLIANVLKQNTVKWVILVFQV